MTHTQMFWVGAVFVLVGFALNLARGFWPNLITSASSSVGLVFVGYSSRDSWAKEVAWALAVIVMCCWGASEINGRRTWRKKEEKDGSERFDA